MYILKLSTQRTLAKNWFYAKAVFNFIIVLYSNYVLAE